MSHRSSFIVEDCNPSDSLGSACDNELFDGILSDVDSADGSKSDKDLICYLNGSPSPCPAKPNTTSINYVKSESMCMSRNAILARENRQKKKEYVQNLEKKVEKLNEENLDLKSKTEQMEVTISDLASEVEYLKGVIANQSTLSKLIGSVCSTPGVRFYSSFTLNNNNETSENEKESKHEPKRKSSVFDDDEDGNQENIASPKAQRVLRKSTRCVQPNKRYSESGISESLCKSSKNDKNGICLHVSGEAVSLEFCSVCSKSASITRKTAVVSGDHTYGRETDQN